MIQNSNGRRSYRAALFVARISLAALAVGAPVRAWAECSPSPNPQLTDITCTGTTNGVTLTAYYAPLTVVSDATVTNTGASAITVAIPSPNGYYSRNAVITVNGIVTAYGAPGITVSSGTTLVSTYDFSGTYASISVAPTGIVSGTTGIALTQSPGPYSIYSPTRVMVYNEGTISGTSGVAISTSGNYARLDSIINTATGTIGAIAARFGQIHNSGTIEGGSLSAISQGNVDSNYLISNNSIIHSASNAATISIASAQSASLSNTIINSHVIANDGAGGAIYSGNYLTIENDAGATIASKGAATIANGSSLALNNLGLITNTGGGMGIIGSNVSINNYFLVTINALPGADAISVSGKLTLLNTGTINGNIVTTLGMDGAMLDSSAGTINGYVRYSNGFDPVTNAFIQVITNNAMLISLLDQQRFSLANSGTITGDIILNGGDMSVVNTGMIRGSLATGAGNDAIAMNGAFSGSINGGAGINTLSVNGGSQAAPVAFASVSNIASMIQTGGFATVSGIGSFGSVMMTGGRLVGLAGSVMNADSFTVGGNATFGSAGAVNGNVVVNGTLSPGASPGTMTVNGNVTLNGGSTSLFEITPTVSDKLIVNGRLTILPGSTLQIAASAPVKVGTTLNLISASGGVTGTYDTVTGITGAVRKLANGDMGLLVQFANPANYTPQVRNAIAYVNNAMAANSAPAALFPALSALQDGNAAPIASAFAQLTPEPYADAMQIGAETALSQAAASRSMGEGEVNGTPHLFGFGQMLGSLRQFSGN